MMFDKKYTAPFLFALFCLFQLQAIGQRFQGDSINSFSGSPVLVAEDEKYGAMQLNGWDDLFYNEEVTAYVNFGIVKESIKNQFSDFAVSIELAVVPEYHDGNNNFTSGPVQHVKLDLSFDPDGTSQTEAYFPFPNAHRISVSITALPGTTDAQLYLSTAVEVKRNKPFKRDYFSATSPTYNINSSFNTATNRIEIDWDAISNAVEYDLEWAHYNAYDNSDPPVALAASAVQLPSDPFRQSARISTKNTHYSIPHVFDKGYLIFRVRGKGKIAADNYTKIYEGDWSSDGKTISTVAAFNDFFDGKDLGHELDKNWNYNAVFTESGKNKYSVTYADGSGRARQSVVNQNDRQESVVAETFYDYQGRAAVQALPAPTGTNNNQLRFFEDFNKSSIDPTLPYSKADFDKDGDGCLTQTAPFAMNETISAGSYYSDQNPERDLGKDMYVPNAKGYAFTQTLFTPDNTGRVRATAAPGETFKHGNDHESKFIYATPYQEELDFLFGADAGYAHKYQKNVSIDANGQASISFLNPAGNTVATVLSGEAPENVRALESYEAGGDHFWVDLLSKQLDTDPIGQLEKLDYSKGTRELSRVLPIVKTGVQEFDYVVKQEKYQPLCEDGAAPYCYECVVNVEVSLKDNCGVEYLNGVETSNSTRMQLGAAAALRTDCNPIAEPYQKEWGTNNGGEEFALKQGAYNLTQRLSIDYEKLNAYTLDFITSNTCLKTKAEFKAEELDKLALLSDCDYTCEQCKAELGEDYDSSPFNETDPNCDPCLTETQYNRLMADCDANCAKEDPCEANLIMLIADMSPGGQYGLTREGSKFNTAGEIVEGSNTFEPWRFPLSIFNENNHLPIRKLTHSGGGDEYIKPSWRSPIVVNSSGLLSVQDFQYPGADGTPFKIYVNQLADGSYQPAFIGNVEVDAEGNEFVYAKNLKEVEDFVRYWRPEWADFLLPFHPEYGYYQYCVLMKVSNDFDQSLIAADDFNELDEDLQSRIMSSQSEEDFFASIDPFFNDQNPFRNDGSDIGDLKTAMGNKLKTYASKDDNAYSIWQMAWMLSNCKDPSCGDCKPPEVIKINNTTSWLSFRALYLSAKQEIMKKHRTRKVINTSHPDSPGYLFASYNECIGKVNFNKYKNDFLLQPIPNYSSYNGPFKWLKKLKKRITSYRPNYASQYYNGAQPCNRLAYQYYANKDPRFGDGFSGTNLDNVAAEACQGLEKYEIADCSDQTEQLIEEGRKQAQVQRYKQCGQCPMTYDLQILLNGIIVNEAHQLTSEGGFIIPCVIPELTEELNSALATSGADLKNSADPDLYWRNEGSREEPRISVGACTIDFPNVQAEYGITYDDVLEICCIKGLSNNEFEFTISYYDPNSIDEPRAILEQTLLASSCLDLLNCDFGNKCNATALGNGLQDVLNAMVRENTTGATSPDLFEQLSSGTYIKLSHGAAGGSGQHYEGVLDPLVFNYLSNLSLADANNPLQWEVSLSNSSDLTGRFFSNAGSSEDCALELKLDNGPSGGNIANIVHFYGMRAVENSGSSYQFKINGVDASNNVYELSGISCMEVIRCTPYLEEDFLMSNNRTSVQNCSPTETYRSLEAYLENISDFSAGISTLADGSGTYALNYADEQGNPLACNLSLSSEIDSWNEVDFTHLRGILDIFLREEEGDKNKMYALVQLCDQRGNVLCDGTTAIVELTVDCGPLFNCNPSRVLAANDDCSYYGLMDQVQQNFMSYYQENFANLSADPSNPNRYLLEDLVPGCSLYLHKGVHFNNVGTGNAALQLNKVLKIPFVDGDPRSPYITGIQNAYIEKEANANGFLLNGYLVCETTEGSLVYFRIEAEESCAFGKCGPCFKPNLVNNGDFEFEGSGNSLSNLHFLINPPQSGTTSHNYLPRANMIGNTFVNYGIVTYNNYYQHMEVIPSGLGSPVPFWNANCSNVPPYIGTHSSISTAATESMTGNFLLVKVRDYRNSTATYPVWEQAILTPVGNSYEFSFDVMKYFEAVGISEAGCVPQLEVNISGIPATALKDFNDNLYRNWKAAQDDFLSCSNGSKANYHHAADRWGLDWKNITIPFTASTPTTTISIHVKAIETLPGLTCGGNEGYFWGFDNISLRERTCNAQRFANLCHPIELPTFKVEDLINSCEDELEASAEYAANVLYKRYIDSVKQSFREAYIRQCLNTYQSFKMNYDDSEHHYTLYYYDQAGNLVRTVPPKGVKKLSATELAEVRANRAQGNKTVFTEHEMATTYAYNSLGQLVQQSVPDHDDLNLFSTDYQANVTSGLPNDFNIRDLAFSNSMNGVVVGFRDLSGGGQEGLIFRTTDGGKTWQEGSSYGTEDYLYISPEKHIVGEKGKLLVFDGTSWKKETTPTNEDLIHLVQEQGTNNLSIYSANGNVWQSTDLGATWSAQHDKLSKQANGMLSAYDIDGSGEGFAVGNAGEIFFTADYGQTWNPRNLIRSNHLAAVHNIGGKFILGGTGGNLHEYNNGNQVNALSSGLRTAVHQLAGASAANYLAIVDGIAGKEVAHSTDGGKSWQQTSFSSSSNVEDLQVENATKVHLLTNNKLYHSTNAGATWVQNNVQPGATNLKSLFEYQGNYFLGRADGSISYSIAGASFQNTAVIKTGTAVEELRIDLGAGKGLARLGNEIYFSTGNTGNNLAAWTWQALKTANTAYANDHFVDLHWISLQEVVAVTDKGKLILSLQGGTDAGGTEDWILREDLGQAAGSFTAVYLNGTQSEGLLVGNNGQVWSSTNGGDTWTDQTHQLRPLALTGLSIDPVNTNHCYAVGLNGTFLTSTDKGMHWLMQNAQTREDLSSIDVNNQNGILAGNGIVGAISNRLVSSMQTSLHHFKEVDYNASQSSLLYENGIALGNNVANLTHRAFPYSSQIKANSILKAGNDLFIVGEGGEIYNSADQGSTWQAENSFVPPALWSVHQINATSFVVGGLDYYLGISEDGGASWREFDHPASAAVDAPTTANIRDLYFSDKNHGLIVSNDGRAFRYDPSGWDPIQIEGGNLGTIDSNYPLYDISMLNDQEGMIVGRRSIYYTEHGIDGTWKLVDDSKSLGLQLLAGHYVDANYAYAAGISGRVAAIERQSNGRLRATVKTQVTLGGQHARSIYFADRKRGYAVGNGGRLYLTTDGADSWEAKESLSPNASMLFGIAFTGLGEGVYVGRDGTFGYLTDYSNYFSDRFYYDALGRLVVSQNAKQFAQQDEVYSYTLYDALGRIKEVGELNATSGVEGNYTNGLMVEADFLAWVEAGEKSEISRTYYSEALNCNQTVVQHLLQDNFDATLVHEDLFDNSHQVDIDLQGGTTPVGSIESINGQGRLRLSSTTNHLGVTSKEFEGEVGNWYLLEADIEKAASHAASGILLRWEWFRESDQTWHGMYTHTLTTGRQQVSIRRKITGKKMRLKIFSGNAAVHNMLGYVYDWSVRKDIGTWHTWNRSLDGQPNVINANGRLKLQNMQSWGGAVLENIAVVEKGTEHTISYEVERINLSNPPHSDHYSYVRVEEKDAGGSWATISAATYTTKTPEGRVQVERKFTPTKDLLRIYITSSGGFPEPMEFYVDNIDIQYEQTPLAAAGHVLEQNHLRNRVSASTYEAIDDGEDCSYDYATHYSYDVHGNVASLYQEFPELARQGQQLKRIDYEYDLISGNVTQVKYQEGASDQFYHKYHYDADNRIEAVLTSHNGVQWNEDANYEYYRHGPLKRTELGDWEVQGMDYAYTLQGWLKGMNSNTMKRERDIGRDGIASAEQHAEVAIDAVGYNLGYYKGDYEAIGAPAQQFEANVENSYIGTSMKELYNGNIAYMTTAFTDNVNDGSGPQAMIYQYDQLNRIKAAVAYTDIDMSNNQWGNNAPSSAHYNTSYVYDANGNITRLTRNDERGNSMDVLRYKYHHSEDQDPSSSDWEGKNSNRLLAVRDSMNNGTDGDDLKPGQEFDASVLERNNYAYDEIGNLIKDEQENIQQIHWTVAGKVKKIQRYTRAGVGQPDLEFFYDAQGNRIRKLVKPREEASGELVSPEQWEETYYVRDAQGNIMSTYQLAYQPINGSSHLEEQLVQQEVNLFGSDRLGSYRANKTISAAEVSLGSSFGLRTASLIKPLAVSSTNGWAERKGLKSYELKNHLGNVLAVISDMKQNHTNNSTTTSNSFTEDFPVDAAEGNIVWKALEESNLIIDEYLQVDVQGEQGGIFRSFDYSPSNGCAYSYCFTVAEGFSEGELYFRAYGDDGLLINQQVQNGENCVSLNPGEVSKIEFYLENTSNGNTFTLTAARMDQICVASSFAYYKPVVKQLQDYYPFGMLMPGRGFSVGDGYRYGFNGMERDDKVKGSGNSYDFGARIYDGRLGKFLSLDPRMAEFVAWSPYLFAANSPLRFVDLNGEGPGDAIARWYYDAMVGVTKFAIENKEYISGTFKMLSGTAMAAGGVIMITAGGVLNGTAIGSIIGIPLQLAGVATISMGVGQVGLGMAQISAEYREEKNKYGDYRNYGELVGEGLENKGLLREGKEIGGLTHDGFLITSSLFSGGSSLLKGDYLMSTVSFLGAGGKGYILNYRVEDFLADGYYDGIMVDFDSYSSDRATILDENGKVVGDEFYVAFKNANGEIIGDGTFRDYINDMGDRIQEIDRNIYEMYDKFEEKIEINN